MSKLKSKVAIVTGSSKGIGAGIARELAHAGAKVVVNYNSAKEEADTLVDEINKAGGTAIAIQGSVTNRAHMAKLFDETKSRFGMVDILVNNAGIYEFGPAMHATEDSFHRLMDTNVLGIILSTQEALKVFNSKGGSIINISSFASTRPEPYSLIYASTKSAVDSLTTTLSQELGPQQIRVNSIRPGGVLTEGIAKLGITEDSDPIKQTISRSALGRMAQPEDMGKLAVFLASDDSALISGQFIEVSAGFR
jgi:3-oxoacyl-[acyl-carrier protein] reductase